ncbi:MAG TPA: replication-associated recombination protein A [Candidatus Saccharimonadales bacterium]|nr:replication-associated recombination protein A [Candidatus Saccharimonadales bacterium]
MDVRPLAERMRPETLEQVVGQEQLTAAGQIVHQIIERKQPTSLILWGPPGSGKTTLARIIARETDAEFIELSAVTAKKDDVRRVVETAQANQRLGMRTILFVDEIHRFNKAQQDAFLPYVEDGTIVLIGATTENPSFEVINPLLSRSRVLVLEPLDGSAIATIVKRTAKELGLNAKKLPAKSIDLLTKLSGGDARVALGNLELAMQLAGDQSITPQVVETAAQTKLPGYDKKGESHYNVISAFIKSMRGSDANATLYYLARMLQAGEDPKFVARRMVIFASEDIGLAAPAALNLAVSTFLAVERIGMPECQYNLFHCAAVLAKAQKSRTLANAMTGALAAAKQYPDLPVPLALRNAPTKLMKDLGYNDGYKWEAGFQAPAGFLPPELADLQLFASE